MSIIRQIILQDGVDSSKVAELDDSTHAQITIDYPHHEIHSGSSYRIATFSDVANAANYDIGLTTPNTTTWAHMVLEVDLGAEFELYVYEGATFTGGAAVTPRNLNRNASDASVITVVGGPTVTATGTEIASSKAGQGKKLSGQIRATAETILKQNTVYLLRMTNVSGGSSWTAPTVVWYEHADKT